MNRSDFRADLNGLRGISVALVLAFHLQLKGAGGGFIGVDVFFVLSGYLMTQIIGRALAEGRFGYWHFVAARAARIWPALVALVVLLFAFGAWRLPPFDLQILAEQARAALLFVSNHHFLDRSGYITHAGDTHWLLHTWSLSVEWQFYLIYPVLLMGLMKLTTRRHTVAAVIAGLLVLSFVWQLLQSGTQAQAGFFLLPGRCWEFLAGGLVFLLRREEPATGPAPVWRALASYAGLAMVLGAALVIALWRRGAVGGVSVLLLPVLGVMLILWSGHQGNLVLRNPVLQHVGLWSYSVYLWHWPLIVGLRMTDYPLDHPGLTMGATVIGSLVMGWWSYSFIEQPWAARGLSVWRTARKPAMAMLLAGGVVAVATATEGLAFRLHGKPDFYRGYPASIKPLYFPDECDNYKKPVAELKTCPVRKRDPARTLVIGDSHGEHLYAWFVRHSPGSVDFFTASECPPVPHFERTQPGYVCQDYAAIAWRKALSADYDTVVVSARWLTVGLQGAPYCHQASEGGRCIAPPSLAAKQALIVTELKAVIAAVLKAGKTVVMVDGSPESRFRVPERIAREVFWYGQARLSVPMPGLIAQNLWLEPLFDAFGDTPGFHRISVRGRLCDGAMCRVYDSTLQRPVFFDESHFDPVWIAAQADLFAPFVR